MCNRSELLLDPVLEEEEGVSVGSPPLLEDEEPVVEDEEPVDDEPVDDEEPVDEEPVDDEPVEDEEPVEWGVLGFPVVEEDELLLLESAILFFTEGF